MIILQGTQIDLLGFKKKIKNINRRKNRKNLRKNLKTDQYSRSFVENFEILPVFNIEAFSYDSENMRLVFDDFVKTEREAIKIIEDVSKNNIYILDYHLEKEKRLPGYLFDFILEHRPDIIYDIAYLVGNGYYFFERDYCKGAMYNLVYKMALLALLSSNFERYDYHKILYVMSSSFPSSGISYIYNSLEEYFLRHPFDFYDTDMPIHLGLIWGMSLSSPSSSNNAVIAGHHVGETSLLDHAINALGKTSYCTDSPFIRYAVFMHDIGKINVYEILEKYGLQEALKYENHYKIGYYILGRLAEWSNLPDELKRVLQIVSLYHGEAALGQEDKKWDKLKIKHPLAYEALMATVRADLGLGCLNEPGQAYFT